MKRIALRVALALAAIAAVAAALAWQQHRPPAPPPAAGNGGEPAVTGTYADDWQASCGPLTGSAQENCTARLNARYGRAEDVPVPKADK
ncbi:hypothetical protein [Phaeospirillum tilakii]|uniref:Conjugative transfer region protein TrbK n=1 Tax=Phaeospirillum tilakii TaxID=741673 RepID=A0ABW5CEK2_9PROT